MIKDFSSKILLVWLFAVASFAQPNSPFSEVTQGKHYQNLWIGGGFTGGGSDILSNGTIKIRSNFLTKGTKISWGDDFTNQTPGFPEGSDLELFAGNVPRIRLGTTVSGAVGAEVYIAGENLLTHFGGGIDVNGGLVFKYYLDIVADDDVPSGGVHPLYSSSLAQKYSYLTTDAVIVDLFRDSNVTDIMAGSASTRFRIGNRFIFDPAANDIRSNGLSGSDTITLFTNEGHLSIGTAGRNTTINGNLVVSGNATFQNVVTSGGAISGGGTGGTFTGALPTHYEGLWKLSFTAAKPIIESNTNEYVYMFSGDYKPAQYINGDPFQGLKPGTLLGLASRPALIIGNASDVAIGNPDRINRFYGTSYFNGTTEFGAGVSWIDVALEGTTTSEGVLDAKGVEENDLEGYQVGVATPETEGEFTQEPNVAYVSQYEANPAVHISEGLLHVEDEIFIDSVLVKLSNLPTVEPTGERNKGALWVSEGEGTLMVAPGIDAPIPKLRWYLGEGDPGELVLHVQDASERSPDDEGEGEIFTEPADVDFDIIGIPCISLDTPPPWTEINFYTKETPDMRNDDGGITITYTIGKEIPSGGPLREETLVWEILPPQVACSASPLALSLLETGTVPVNLINNTVDGPIKPYIWKWEIVDPIALARTIYEEGENESPYTLDLSQEETGEGGLGEILEGTEITFRLTVTSVVNEKFADVVVTVYPPEE